MITVISPSDLQARLDAEEAVIRKLKILFGGLWRCYAFPHELKWTLYTEREVCPYCAVPLQIVSDLGAQGLQGTLVHIDHMDPLSRGGEESFRNAICVCAACNISKGRLLFADWLTRLTASNQEIARKIYKQKLGREPEDFQPGPKQIRQSLMRAELGFDEAVLRKLYPKPVVWGAPKRKL